MLTRLIVKNFKRFRKAEIELGNPVVFIGPNNSGKTAALQALALWDIGVKRWLEKRRGKGTPEKRPGVTINRRDLIAVPVPNANLLWQDLHVRDLQKVEKAGKLSLVTRNICVEIVVEGIGEGKLWKCGMEFDYANEESFYCRPLRKSEANDSERMVVPEEAAAVRVAFLPPMSGLAANETRLDPGAINVRLGEGRTAEVLRNLCYQIVTEEDGKKKWQKLCDQMEKLFGVNLEEPVYSTERGEITMKYRERGPSRVRLDLSSSGRGLQQTLLLLAHLTVNPNSVLLLDEPDAHLEILRQSQIYHLLTETAREQGSQIIVASHSEVILNEAAGRDVVVAFVGRPHRIDDRSFQLLKSLKEIDFDQFYKAEQTGWVLYLEGSTDLAILRTFAKILNHPAQALLEGPFVYYVQNQPNKARSHFCGLREAKSDLVGFALFDRLDQNIAETPALKEYMWKRKEIENYFLTKNTLLAYADALPKETGLPLIDDAERERRRNAMQECIELFILGAAKQDPDDKWWKDTKASEPLDRIFERFFNNLDLSTLMWKADYHILARYMPKDQIDPEVTQVLDYIVEVAGQAKPLQEDV